MIKFKNIIFFNINTNKIDIKIRNNYILNLFFNKVLITSNHKIFYKNNVLFKINKSNDKTMVHWTFGFLSSLIFLKYSKKQYKCLSSCSKLVWALINNNLLLIKENNILFINKIFYSESKFNNFLIKKLLNLKKKKKRSLTKRSKKKLSNYKLGRFYNFL